MKLNKSSRYALYAVVLMVEEGDARVTASTVAKKYKISEAHVAKVLQQLSRARIVTSTRGLNGGYQLAADPRELTMWDVVEALEGPRAPGCYGCDEQEDCGQAEGCALRGVLEEIGQQIYYTMKSVTIAALAEHGQRFGVASAQA